MSLLKAAAPKGCRLRLGRGAECTAAFLPELGSGRVGSSESVGTGASSG